MSKCVWSCVCVMFVCTVYRVHVVTKTTATNSNLLSQTTNSLVCFYMVLQFVWWLAVFFFFCFFLLSILLVGVSFFFFVVVLSLRMCAVCVNFTFRLPGSNSFESSWSGYFFTTYSFFFAPFAFSFSLLHSCTLPFGRHSFLFVWICERTRFLYWKARALHFKNG